MTDLSQRRVQQQIIEQPPQDTLAGVDPTAIRYGWCPYKDIPILGPDGLPNPYVQQYEIAGPGGNRIRNPFFAKLPKGQLIPFPTFSIQQHSPSQDVRLPDGRPALDTVVTQQTALACVVLVSRVYGRWGFTILQSLQGLDQRTAQRIFTVVQPYDWPIGEVQSELAFADDRINATEPITLSDNYIIDCLQDAGERSIALRLRGEMADGADIGFALADEEFNETKMSMINRHNGGQGKAVPSPHDRYLADELGRGLPQVIEEKKEDLAKLEAKLDYVVDREKNREAQEEISKLRLELQELRGRLEAEAGEAKTVGPAAETYYCEFMKADNTPCQNAVKNPGDRCFGHRNKEEVNAGT